jgi:hypothetical protein
MENLQLPKNEKKVKLLTVPVTQAEHETIRQYCQEKNVKLTTLIRFALKKTYNINLI